MSPVIICECVDEENVLITATPARVQFSFAHIGKTANPACPIKDFRKGSFKEPTPVEPVVVVTEPVCRGCARGPLALRAPREAADRKSPSRPGAAADSALCISVWRGRHSSIRWSPFPTTRHFQGWDGTAAGRSDQLRSIVPNRTLADVVHLIGGLIVAGSRRVQRGTEPMQFEAHMDCSSRACRSCNGILSIRPNAPAAGTAVSNSESQSK